MWSRLTSSLAFLICGLRNIGNSIFAPIILCHAHSAHRGLGGPLPPQAFDMFRFFGLVKPSSTEALVAVFIYLGLYASRIEEVRKMEKHYQVSFYASCGWTFYALASLIHAISCGPEPMLERGAAESLHTLGAVVFLLSCGYFYSYHWGRIFRHIQEGRFRPFFALGLGSLTFVHGLTARILIPGGPHLENDGGSWMVRYRAEDLPRSVAVDR
ncbi:unnamed protein product [Effrenium voratum]|uniref:Uncharacterized protein n=1 Tax=Effrenium voratum TaxID=2562239 RepID=A0AA36HTF9_9DINO|nr:unnamed protein product [Effrenium voratum]